MSVYYIYTLADPRSGTVRYIGKGNKYRYNWCLHSKCEDQYGVEPWILRLRKLGLVPVINKIMENLTKEQACQQEIELIKKIGKRPDGPLLNRAPGGLGGGFKQTEATKQKISETLKGRGKGRKLSAKTCQKLSESHTGKTQTKATRQKIAESRAGVPRSKATCQKMSEANKGKTHTRATRQKISQSLAGKKRKPCSEATKQKISKSQKGRVFSDKHRQNLSQAMKGNKNYLGDSK